MSKGKLPRSVARRIATRKSIDHKVGFWSRSLEVVNPLSSLGLLIIAIYAAFFSPFSEVVEAQLRSELASTTNERAQLSQDVSDLKEQRDNLTKEAADLAESNAEQTQLIKSQLSNISRLELETSRLNAERDKLGNELVEMYFQQQLYLLPFQWGEKRIPYVYVEILNAAARNQPFDPNARFADSYDDYTELLHEMTSSAKNEYQLKSAQRLRERFLRNCPNRETFLAEINEVLRIEDSLQTEEEKSAGTSALRALTKMENFCFQLDD